MNGDSGVIGVGTAAGNGDLEIGWTDGHAGGLLGRIEFLGGSRESHKTRVESAEVVPEHIWGVAIGVDGHEHDDGISGEFRVLIEHLGQLRQMNRADVRAGGVPEVEKCELAFGLCREVEWPAVDVRQRELGFRPGWFDRLPGQLTGAGSRPGGADT